MTDETFDPTRPGPPREVSEDAAAREAEQMAPEVLADILHALGRPDDPMRKTYRNYYCGTPEGHDTPLWRCTREAGEVCPEPFYSVTNYGREQAAKALKDAAALERSMTAEHGVEMIATMCAGEWGTWMSAEMQQDIATIIRKAQEQARAEEREQQISRCERIIREAQEMIRSHPSITETMRGSIKMMLAVMADEIRNPEAPNE